MPNPEHFENICYACGAALQLAAIVFAVRMMREAKDRMPWLVMLMALGLMFLFRAAAVMMPVELRSHLAPPISVVISALLFIALFSVRRVAAAERESRSIAERRTSERDESENRYRALVELSPDAIFVNAGGKFAYANAACQRFFGARSEAELLGRSPVDFTVGSSREIVEARIAALVEVGQVVPPIAEDWKRLDGSLIPVEAAAAVVPWRGGKAIQVILRDMSERKRAEDEKNRLLASERDARGVAERASQLKDEFLAVLSHELRTPLNAIVGWSQILRRGTNSKEEVEQGLETIERNARVQAKLIEDLLDMSRIIAGKLRLDVQRLSPASFTESAIETLRPAAEAKGVQIEQTLDRAAGPISGDSNRLQQIVWNLLSNAIKFTPRGGKITVALARVGFRVEISVADTGRGIKPEFLPFVFDRFRQADSSTTRQFGGLGIGLAIVKQLVELHGGWVRADSPGEGLGSTLCVSLPIAVVLASSGDGEASQPCEARGPGGSVETIELKGLKVLVVDDEADATELLRRTIEECHATVLVADSTQTALQTLESQRPDVLISDIGMPDKDGYDLIREVRARSALDGGRIPAIALTAFARSEDRTRALLAGYQIHLAKPVEPHELIATIASLAGRTGAPV